jgi:hypothetical protein
VNVLAPLTVIDPVPVLYWWSFAVLPLSAPLSVSAPGATSSR